MRKQNKRAYFAHAVCLYGTKEEEKLLRQIKAIFPDFEIVDPGSYEDNLEKIIGVWNIANSLLMVAMF